MSIVNEILSGIEEQEHKIFVALDVDLVDSHPVAPWGMRFIRSLREVSSDITVLSTFRENSSLEQELIAEGIEVISVSGENAEFDASGHLKARFRARQIINLVKRAHPSILFVQGFELSRFVAGTQKFANILWSLPNDDPRASLLIPHSERKWVANLASGSRQILVTDEISRAHLEAIASECTGRIRVIDYSFSGSFVPKDSEITEQSCGVVLVDLMSDIGDFDFRTYGQQMRDARSPKPLYVVASDETKRKIRTGEKFPELSRVPNLVFVDISEAQEDWFTDKDLIGLVPSESSEQSVSQYLVQYYAAMGIASAVSSHTYVGAEIGRGYRFTAPNVLLEGGLPSVPAELLSPTNLLRAESIISLLRHQLGSTSSATWQKKINVLLAGHDFKFAAEMVEAFNDHPQINFKVDLFKSSATVQPEISSELLPWADVIVCEFATYNALWYSQAVSEDQKLIVHLHGYELLSTWIDQLSIDNVYKIVFASEFYRNTALEKKGWPIQKTAVIPNGVNSSDLYRQKKTDARFHIGIAGIVPILKRPDRALEVLRILRKHDERYTLHVRGHAPWNYAWEWKKASHKDAYYAFYQAIGNDSMLREAVAFEPFGPDMGSWFSKIGWMLSPSYRETFHLAPVEGMASGAVPVVWEREGSREIFGDRWNFESSEEIADFILQTNKSLESYLAESQKARDFVQRYDSGTIRNSWTNLCFEAASSVVDNVESEHTDSAFVPELPESPSAEQLFSTVSALCQLNQYGDALGILDDNIPLTRDDKGKLKSLEMWVRGIFALDSSRFSLMPSKISAPSFDKDSNSIMWVMPEGGTVDENWELCTADTSLFSVGLPRYLKWVYQPSHGFALDVEDNANVPMRADRYINYIAESLVLKAQKEKVSKLVICGPEWLALAAIIAGRLAGIPVVWDARSETESLNSVVPVIKQQFHSAPLAQLTYLALTSADQVLISEEVNTDILESQPVRERVMALRSGLGDQAVAFPSQQILTYMNDFEEVKYSDVALSKTSVDNKRLRIGLIAGEVLQSRWEEFAEIVPLYLDSWQEELWNDLDLVVVDSGADSESADWKRLISYNSEDRSRTISAFFDACRRAGVPCVLWSRHSKENYGKYWQTARKADFVLTAEETNLQSYLTIMPSSIRWVSIMNNKTVENNSLKKLISLSLSKA